MHSQKNNKYSLFKSNRSQASLLSNQSAQEKASIQASPIDSPLASPAFPPPSAASSPLSPDHNPDRDDNLVRAYETDASRFYQTGVPRRTQSQRTPPLQRQQFGPTINVVTPTAGGAGSPRIDEDQDPAVFYAPQQPPARVELKKKRRFFGIGSDSSSTREPAATPSSPPTNPPKSIGRSISVRRTIAPPTHIETSDLGPYTTPYRQPSGSVSARLPSAPVEHESESTHRPDSDFGQYTLTPQIPPKDPPRSPGFLPVSDYKTYGQAQSQAYNAASDQSQLVEEDPTRPLAWEKLGGRTADHQRNPSTEHSTRYQAYIPDSSSASSTSSHPLPIRNPQDLAYPYSQNSRPSSRQSYDPPSPAGLQPHDGRYHTRTSSLQQVPTYTDKQMGIPNAPPHGSGRSTDSGAQTQQGPNRESLNYTPHAQQQGGSQNGQNSQQYGTQLSVSNSQTRSYQGTPQPSPMVPQNSNSERTVGSTPPPRPRDDLSGLDVQGVIQRHDELNEKYRKVKKYYFDKDAQVQQLQNLLAHQRLAQSRTSLDDNEYAARFSRLDGAINNLAFNIRKDWRAVPSWLAPYVNKDATTTVTKEMTAVGRACISRWLADELLDRFFHPGLERSLSAQLKNIEKNLRRFAPPTPTEEEKESLLTKISNWRLSTLDGLQDMLASYEAQQNRAALTENLVQMLTEDLVMNLKEPPPPGLDAGVIGIVELAVGIAANLPLESRDVFVDYIMPGTLVNEAYMKVEGALPALTNPGEGMLGDTASLGSADEKDHSDRDSVKDLTPQQQQQVQQQAAQQAAAQQQAAQAAQKKKGGMLAGLMGKKPVTTPTPPGSSRGNGSQAEAAAQMAKDERVRFAAFMAVEVRGKNMLIKAPVYV